MIGASIQIFQISFATTYLIMRLLRRQRRSLGRGIQQFLIHRTFLRNLLHKLFSRNQPLLN